MKVTYEKNVDAAYIYLANISPGGVAFTYENVKVAANTVGNLIRTVIKTGR